MPHCGGSKGYAMLKFILALIWGDIEPW